MLKRNKILIDCRELNQNKLTGIGRFIIGLTSAISDSQIEKDIILAGYNKEFIKKQFENCKISQFKELPLSFLKSEKALIDLCKKNYTLLVSPYSKLPLFNCNFLSINTVHDVHDLTHPAYKNFLRNSFYRYRIKHALRKASLTWYVSSWSLNETKKLLGSVGYNPKVRHNGIEAKFVPGENGITETIMGKYRLRPDYILVLGNGLPHKNIQILLEIHSMIERHFVFIGIPTFTQKFFVSQYPNAKCRWLTYIDDEDLPVLMREAFCIAQPSTAEGYGYPPLEAMACGTPAVISDIPVLIETTGGNAITADPHDPKAWITAFEALEQNSVYQSQVDKGLKWVEPIRGNKGWVKHVSDIEALLSSNSLKNIDIDN